MRSDSLALGVVGGLLMPVAGFFLYATMYVTAIRPQHELSYFINDLFLGTRVYQAPVLSISLLANLALFFLFDRFGMVKSMRGVIISTFIYGIAIVALSF
jgi:hypothetical protein